MSVRLRPLLGLALTLSTGLVACESGNVYIVDPTTYQSALENLTPGDTMVFSPGVYADCLRIDGLHGTANARITLTGPETGPPAIISGRTCETPMVRIQDSSFVTIRALELDGMGEPVAGLQAGFGLVPVHDIIVERLYIHDNDVTSQFSCISSFAVAWNWIIRDNRLERCGLGLYLGDSDGTAPFIKGIIEHNVVVDPKGYAMQIKHQVPRPNVAGMPGGDNITIIRHNVFAKTSNSVTGNAARPNLLVGHFPTRGVGQDDRYEIYGNFLFENDNDQESLFQGEGNVSFHDNVLYNSFSGPGIWIRPHNDVPRDVAVYRNTIVTQGMAVSIGGGDMAFSQTFIGNAVFSNSLPAVDTPQSEGNFVGTIADAASRLSNPNGNAFDAYPLAGQLVGDPFPLGPYAGHTDFDRDFNGTIRADGSRGAYQGGAGANPGWGLTVDFKPRTAGTQSPDAGMSDPPAVDMGGGPQPPLDAGFADAGFDDMGSPIDSGNAQPPADSGVGQDAGPVADAGTGPVADSGVAGAPDAGSGGTAGRGTDGGCGCSLAPLAEDRTAIPWLFGLLFFGLGARARRR